MCHGGGISLNYIQEYKIRRFLRRALDIALFAGGVLLVCYSVLRTAR